MLRVSCRASGAGTGRGSSAGAGHSKGVPATLERRSLLGLSRINKHERFLRGRGWGGQASRANAWAGKGLHSRTGGVGLLAIARNSVEAYFARVKIFNSKDRRL